MEKIFGYCPDHRGFIFWARAGPKVRNLACEVIRSYCQPAAPAPTPQQPQAMPTSAKR
jgi:hypothetical protein